MFGRRRLERERLVQAIETVGHELRMITEVLEGVNMSHERVLVVVQRILDMKVDRGFPDPKMKWG